jgi:hypothetical protein
VFCEDILHATAKSLAENIDRLIAFPSYNPSRLFRRLEAAIATIREYGLLLPGIKWELAMCAQQESIAASHIFARRSDSNSMHVDQSESIPTSLSNATGVADALHDKSRELLLEAENELTPKSCCSSPAIVCQAALEPKVGGGGGGVSGRPIRGLSMPIDHAAGELSNIGDAIARKLQELSFEPIKLPPILDIEDREMQLFVSDKRVPEKQHIRCSSLGGERDKLHCWIDGQFHEPLKQLSFYSKMLQEWTVLLEEAHVVEVGNDLLPFDWAEQEVSAVKSLHALARQVLFVPRLLHSDDLCLHSDSKLAVIAGRAIAEGDI